MAYLLKYIKYNIRIWINGKGYNNHKRFSIHNTEVVKKIFLCLYNQVNLDLEFWIHHLYVAS